MTDLTATQLALLRSRPQSTVLNLSIYQPPVVFQARVNNAAAAANDSTIIYDGVTFGAFGSVVAGMTMLIGSTLGGYDVGRVRVRSADATTIKVAENSDIVWVDDLYLTVINFHEPWAVYPNIVLDGDNVPTFYKDTDIAYVGQNDTLDPVPMMGPHLAGVLDPDTGQVGFYFDGSACYDLNAGGTISSYIWIFEGALTSASLVATPGWIYWSTPGHYTVTMVVLNSSGRTATAYRHVSVYSGPGGPSPVVVDWGLNNLAGDYGRGGWSGRVWMRQDASEDAVMDGALVVIFADDKYASTEQSIGGQYINRENIVFVGYVADGTVSIDPQTSIVEFDIVNLALKLATSEVFSVSVTSVVSPGTWYELKEMTVDIAIYHYIRWHTTLYDVADINKNGDVLPVQYADFSREAMQTALDGFLSSTLMARFCVDHQGQCWMEKDISIVEAASRAPDSTFALTRYDWRDKLDIAIKRIPPTSYVELGGINYAGPAAGTYTAVISSAPGLSPKYAGVTTILNGLVLGTQEQTSQLAGNVLAKLNNRFADIKIPLAGNYRIFDIAPQQRITITLTADENYAGLVWAAKNTIPRGISFQYSRQASVLLVDLTVEAETDGPPGVAGPYPIIPPDDPPIPNPVPPTPPPIPVPPPVTQPLRNNMFGLGPGVVIATTNFLATPSPTAPAWTNETGAITGTPLVLRLDPWDPSNKAYVLADNGMWRTTTLRSHPPVWTNVLTLAQMRSATDASAEFKEAFWMSPNAQNYAAIVVTSSTGAKWFGRTSNVAGGAATWTREDIIHGTYPYFWLSQHTIQKIWIAGTSNRILYSSDGGASFTAYSPSLPDADAPFVIFIPFDSNDARIYLSTFGGANVHIFKSTTGPVPSTFTDISPSAGGYPVSTIVPEGMTESPSSTGSNLYAMCTQNNQNIGALMKYDGSAWVQKTIGVAAEWRGFGFGGWPYDSLKMQVCNAEFGAGKIGRSEDGGVTWLDATGNLASLGSFVNGVKYLVPIWVTF